MKSFASPQKETKHIHASAADLLVQMPEAVTGGVPRKKVFFKMSQNSQETPVPEETPMNFAKFLRTAFLQKGICPTISHTDQSYLPDR